MARKITEDAVHAFMVAGKNFSNSNTSVMIEGDMVVLRLHGHAIARREVGSNQIQVTNAGWNTRTTNDRLNGLPGVSVHNSKGELYLNGNVWDGEWTNV